MGTSAYAVLVFEEIYSLFCTVFLVEKGVNPVLATLNSAAVCKAVVYFILSNKGFVFREIFNLRCKRYFPWSKVVKL